MTERSIPQPRTIISRCVRHIRPAVVICLVTSIAAPQMVCAQESLSSQSESAMQHRRLGMREVDKERFPTARPHFEAAVAADPSWGYAHLQLSTRATKAADLGHADARHAGADAASFVNIGLSLQQLEDGFTSMFNGKDSSGWDGATEFWTVQDGAIVVETKRTSQQTIFLYWTGGEPADFEMRCPFRISGTEANSGIQIRPQRVPEWDALGYQADFDVSGYSVGNLYLFGRKPLATFVQRGDSVRIDSSGNRTVSNFPIQPSFSMRTRGATGMIIGLLRRGDR